MWNYSFAIPSFIIITIILLFYYSLPRLSIRMNRVFLALLLVEGVVIFADIISSYACDNYQSFGKPALWILNGLFFVFFFVRAYMLFAFNASAFRLEPFQHKLSTFLLRIPAAIGVLLVLISPVTGAVFTIDDSGYHPGPLYATTYYVSWFYIVMSLIILGLYRNNLKRRRHWISMAMYNLALIVGIICRRLFPQYLLMDTFCLIAILIVYLAMENPEFYLESRGSVFNSTAFRDYIDEHNGQLNHGIMGIVVKNYHEMRDIYGGRQIDAGIVLISDYLTQTYKSMTVFYYRKGRFILLGSKGLDYKRVAKDITRRFDLPFTSDNLELYLEVGTTYMEVENSVESADTLLNTLIAAFDKAEKSGTKECICISSDELKSNENETAIKRCLENAVDNDAVEVFLQPLIDARTDRLVGAEALCRIRDDQKKLIPPGLFIPIAEANGRINDLGEQVFIKTCRFLKENDISKMGMSWINVNLSPVQFMKSDLAERYDSIVKEYQIDPDRIHLEITEESLVDENFLTKQVQSMQDKGFNFVLDDYGTGYSNITRLKRISFINIKLDMSVVWDYYKEPDNILPSMVYAFKNMGFGVTAEGIEDEQMAAAMKNIGLDLLQGYYYSKSISMDEFVKKYRAKNA